MTRHGPMLMLLLLGFYAICEAHSILKTESEKEDEVLLRQKRDLGISAAAITAALTGVIAGTSVATATTAFQVLNFNVKMEMSVENLTKWPMVGKFAEANSGYIYSDLPWVHSGRKEAFVTHKTGSAAKGTSGTVGWSMEGVGHVVVMWSVPYNQDFYSNWLGVGVRTGRIYNTRNLFTQMYYDPETWFKRKEFYYNTSPLIFCTNAICIYSSLGSAHRTQAAVTILPRNHVDLAPTLKSRVTSHNWNQAMINFARGME